VAEVSEVASTIPPRGVCADALVAPDRHRSERHPKTRTTGRFILILLYRSISVTLIILPPMNRSIAPQAPK